jgi:hypothetical protein
MLRLLAGNSNRDFAGKTQQIPSLLAETHCLE